MTLSTANTPTLRLLSRLFASLLLLRLRISALNSDGALLLSFKDSVLSDPLSILANWNYQDETPCSWTGVSCSAIPSDTLPRVVALLLPSCKLLATVPADLALLPHLRHVDLSHNLLNGTLPPSLFNASELAVLALSDNEISGSLPTQITGLRSLQLLNLSGNALVGEVPASLTLLPNLTVLSLGNNYLTGPVPSRLASVQALDLSSNILNGSLPPDFGGGESQLRSLNLSSNRLSGQIPSELASRLPANVSLDLSFNNLTGSIPQALVGQVAEVFAGNSYLCGVPVRKPCTVESSPSEAPRNASTPNSPPAFAAIPRSFAPEAPPGSERQKSQSRRGLNTAAIAGILVGDVVGILILSAVFVCVYRAKIRSDEKKTKDHPAKVEKVGSEQWTPELGGGGGWSCLRKNGETDDTSETPTESESEEQKQNPSDKNECYGEKKNGALVTVDGEAELELETLLRASAYILGATSTSIVYKAVLEDGTALAVRRIGESEVARFRDFENQVRAIAKLCHPNLVRIRGFYWGADEKLVIYDYVPNGSLANATYKRIGSSSPYHLSWDVRLRIARGVARGLTYLHDKKYVHGNLKPSNILLGPNMEPKVGDFGLERLVSGESSSSSKTVGNSARHFGSKRSTASRDSIQDLSSTLTSRSLSSAPYHSPESLKNLKPHHKWDVYSFGIVLLELVSGKVYTDAELGQWSARGFNVEEKFQVLRMADVAVRADVEGREETLLACLKLGFSCASLAPQKRPSMKEALQILDKLQSSSSHQRSPYS